MLLVPTASVREPGPNAIAQASGYSGLLRVATREPVTDTEAAGVLAAWLPGELVPGLAGELVPVLASELVPEAPGCPPGLPDNDTASTVTPAATIAVASSHRRMRRRGARVAGGPGD